MPTVNKTHKTAIVAIPPENVWGPIQAIRRDHDSKTRRWMPHITLIYPFVGEEEFAAVARDVAAECKAIQPVDVTLTSVDSFGHAKGRYTVWLKPESTEPLLDLHAAVWTAVSPEQDFEPRIGRFAPHLSVGQAHGQAKRDRLVSELRARWSPISFKLAAIQIVARDDPPNDVFRVRETIQLGS